MDGCSCLFAFFDFGGEPTPQQGYMGSVTETTIANDRQKLGGTFFSKLTTQSKLDGSIGNMITRIRVIIQSGPWFFNTTSSSEVFNITLKLNGQERFSPQGISYFPQKQIYDHHTGPGKYL